MCISLGRSIVVRALTSHVALAVIPLLLVSLFALQATDRGSRELAERANLEIARRAAGEVSLFVSHALGIVRTAADFAALVAIEPFALDNLVNTIKRNQPVVSRLSVFGLDGACLATTEFGRTLPPDTSVAFRQAASGRAFVSGVFITADGLPAMTVAEPVAVLGLTVAVVRAELDLRAMWELVDAIEVGRTGSASVVSPDGMMIAARSRARVYAQENLRGVAVVDSALAGRAGEGVMGAPGGKVIACAVPIRELGWALVVEQPESEALAIGRRLKLQILLGVLAVLGVSVAVGVVFARRLVRPIGELVSGVRAVSTGDLSARIPEPAPDELGLLAREFNKMAVRLSENQERLARIERMSALSRFAGVVAHEVRNPLNSISLNLEVVAGRLRELAPDDESLAHVRLIKGEVDRLAAIVRDFLAVSRLPEVHTRRVDLHDVVTSVIELVKLRAAEQKVAIESDLEHVVASADPDRLKQALLNVVENSLYVMPDGGRLEVALRADGGDAVVSVADTGPGFDPDEPHRAVELAFTTKPEGLGVGLSIAQMVAEGHRGRLVLTNKAGGGALVSFRLPLSGSES